MKIQTLLEMDQHKNTIHTRKCDVDKKYLPEFENILDYIKEHGDDSVKLSFDRSWGITVMFKNPKSNIFDDRTTDMYLKDAYKNPNNKVKIIYSYHDDETLSPAGFMLIK